MPAISSPRVRNAPRPFVHKASGKAVVKIRGRFYYLGPPGSDAAKSEYQRLIREVWSRPKVAPPGLTAAQCDRLSIVDLLAAYWQHADRYYVKDGKPTSTIAGIAPALRLLREMYGDQLAAEFGPLKLQALRHAWIEGGQVTRTTINHYTSYVKRVFYWAAKNELVPANVAHALRFVDHLAAGRSAARESDAVTAVDDELVEATLPHLPAIVADMVRFQRLTGARPGEVCSLRADQVKRYADAKPMQLHRSASRPLFPDELPLRGEKLEVWEYRPPGHKMAHHAKLRVVFIGPKAQAILDEYLARAGDGRCFPYSVGSYRRAVARACIRALMPKRLRTISRRLPPQERAALKEEAAAWRKAHVWSPNQLRHAAASAVTAHFGEQDGARVLLGHGSEKTTAIYAQRDLAKARDIAREVG
jgi:integrase